MAPDEQKVLHATSGDTIYHGLHNFSSGNAILVPGYKFRGWQFGIVFGFVPTTLERVLPSTTQLDVNAVY